MYTYPSWDSIPKTQFVRLSYPIDFLGHLLTDYHKWTTYLFIIRKQKQGTSIYFIFLFYFILFLIILHFSIFRTMGLGLEVIGHTVTSVTFWWYDHNIDYRTREKEVKGSETKWCHTTWTSHVDLMLYTWPFRVGCTVASIDHLYKYIR